MKRFMKVRLGRKSSCCRSVCTITTEENPVRVVDVVRIFDFVQVRPMHLLLVKRLECYSDLKERSLKRSCGTSNCPKIFE